jgi:drug/metabolite transporter (DMT)-like permease
MKLVRHFIPLLSLLPVPALAGAVCRVNGQEVPCPQGMEGALFGFGIFFLVAFAIGIFFFILWIMMIVHAATHPIPNRAMWILVLVFTQGLGALIYYFVVKRNFGKTPSPAMPTPPPTVPAEPPSPPAATV